MLIKSADDKGKRIALLEELQKAAGLSSGQRNWLNEELFRLRRGIQGERDAAHYLDNYLRDDPDRAVIHDLRISVDGDIAQIDHLVMTRSMHFYLLETKNFGGSLHINAQGEFSVEYSNERVFGIASPIEQSRRHEVVLSKLFERLEICGRNGGKPKIHHCVLVDPRALIHRPEAKAYDTSMVIKADQFRSWHEKFQEKASVIEVFGSVWNIRGSDTVKNFAEKLLRQHRPADLLSLPEFMKLPPPATSIASKPSVATRATLPMAARPASVPAAAQHPPADTGAERKRSLVCATCGSKITFAEGRFCWGNEKRFGGLQYCREHQAAF